MITNLEPPTERDLPPERAARMRAALLHEARDAARHESRGQAALLRLRDGRDRGRGWAGFLGFVTRAARRPGRTGMAIAVVVAVAAAGATLLLPRDPPPAGVTTLAMGPAELSPSLLTTVRSCLNRIRADEQFDKRLRELAATSDLAVAIEHHGRAIAVFFGADGYLTCDEVRSPANMRSSGFGVDQWHGQRDWLPGPVQRMGGVSSELDHGWVLSAGRVSYRVDRLVLEHGNGNHTEARLANGAFGLISATDDVQSDAELVAYDADGRVIERERFYEPLAAPSKCYTDPAGKVIYSRVPRPDRDCLPAEPWKR